MSTDSTPQTPQTQEPPKKTWVPLLFNPTLIYEQSLHVCRANARSLLYMRSTEDMNTVRSFIYQFNMAMQMCIGTDSGTGLPAIDETRIRELATFMNETMIAIAKAHDQRRAKEQRIGEKDDEE